MSLFHNSHITQAGQFSYFHFGQGSFDDRGWGCAYRSAQMLLSWYTSDQACSEADKEMIGIPSLLDIQKALVAMGDKPASFEGSRQWIGSYEICLLLDWFYNASARVLSIHPDGRETRLRLDGCQGKDISNSVLHVAEEIVPEIHNHIKVHGTPCMIGRDGGGALVIAGIALQHETDIRNSRILVLGETHKV